jgi:dTMP kinase
MEERTTMSRGRFFVIEGCDAVGKATQSKLLAARLHRSDDNPWGPPPPVLVSFPRYETPVGKMILRHLRREVVLADGTDEVGDVNVRWECSRASEDALAFQCMMLADKAEAAGRIVAQLAEGADVVADRYWPSAFAYGGSDGLPDEWLIDVHRILPQPDRFILLDLHPEAARERALRRAAATGERLDRYEAQLDKQVAIRERYLQLAARDPERWRVVEAGYTVEDVAESVATAAGLPGCR